MMVVVVVTVIGGGGGGGGEGGRGEGERVADALLDLGGRRREWSMRYFAQNGAV